jgi:hypothetical protein
LLAFHNVRGRGRSKQQGAGRTGEDREKSLHLPHLNSVEAKLMALVARVLMG